MSKIDLSFFVPTVVLMPLSENQADAVPKAAEELVNQDKNYQKYTNEFVAGWTLNAEPGRFTRVKAPGSDIWIQGSFPFLHTLLQYEKALAFESIPLKLVRVFYEDRTCWELVSETTLNVLRGNKKFIECVSENFVELDEVMMNDVILYKGTKIIVTGVKTQDSQEWRAYQIEGKVESTMKPYTFPRFYIYHNNQKSHRLYRYSKPENNLLGFIPYLQVFQTQQHRCRISKDAVNQEVAVSATLDALRTANTAIVPLPLLQDDVYYSFSCAFLLKGAQPLWAALTEDALKAYFQKHKTLSFGHPLSTVVNYGNNANGLTSLVFDVAIGRSRKKEHFSLQNAETRALYTQLYKKTPAEYLTYAEIVQFIQNISENYALLLPRSDLLIDNFAKVGLKHLFD